MQNILKDDEHLPWQCNIGYAYLLLHGFTICLVTVLSFMFIGK